MWTIIERDGFTRLSSCLFRFMEHSRSHLRVGVHVVRLVLEHADGSIGVIDHHDKTTTIDLSRSQGNVSLKNTCNMIKKGKHGPRLPHPD